MNRLGKADVLALSIFYRGKGDYLGDMNSVTDLDTIIYIIGMSAYQ